MYKKNKMAEWVKFAILLIFALLVLYPLIWMVGSSFKPEADIFTDLPFFLIDEENDWQLIGAPERSHTCEIAGSSFSLKVNW